MARFAEPTVDPDRSEPQLLRRGVVVKEALGNVNDLMLFDAGGIQPVEHHSKIAQRRLVATDVLGGNDPVEVDHQLARENQPRARQRPLFSMRKLLNKHHHYW